MNDFSRQDIESLKASTDLADLMRSYGIELKAVGKNFSALCPWHDDRDASLVVNPAKQLYNCFGCEAKGDALSFLQVIEDLTFGQAVLKLRELTGSHPVSEASLSPPDDPDRFAGGLTRPQLLTRVAEHYKKGLAESTKAQEYLKSRGLRRLLRFGKLLAWVTVMALSFTPFRKARPERL